MIREIKSSLEGHDCDLCGGPLDEKWGTSTHYIVEINNNTLELHKFCKNLAIDDSDSSAPKFKSLDNMVRTIRNDLPDSMVNYFDGFVKELTLLYA